MTPRLIVGLAIALFGVVLVLDRLNLVIADQVLRWWPVVIVAIGALIFTQSRRVGGGINGVIVMIIGGWPLLNTVGILRVRFWEMFWPLVLIGIGSVLVLQALRRRTREATVRRRRRHADHLRRAERREASSAAERFRGGEITAFMGGAQLDLRQATIPPGEEAALDIFVVMGGCEISCRRPGWVTTPLVPVMEGSTTSDRPSAGQRRESSAAGRLRAWCCGADHDGRHRDQELMHPILASTPRPAIWRCGAPSAFSRAGS